MSRRTTKEETLLTPEEKTPLDPAERFQYLKEEIDGRMCDIKAEFSVLKKLVEKNKYDLDLNHLSQKGIESAKDEIIRFQWKKNGLRREFILLQLLRQLIVGEMNQEIFHPYFGQGSDELEFKETWDDQYVPQMVKWQTVIEQFFLKASITIRRFEELIPTKKIKKQEDQTKEEE